MSRAGGVFVSGIGPNSGATQLESCLVERGKLLIGLLLTIRITLKMSWFSSTSRRSMTVKIYGRK